MLNIRPDIIHDMPVCKQLLSKPRAENFPWSFIYNVANPFLQFYFKSLGIKFIIYIVTAKLPLILQSWQLQNPFSSLAQVTLDSM
jgi:hypothetical protein